MTRISNIILAATVAFSAVAPAFAAPPPPQLAGTGITLGGHPIVIDSLLAPPHPLPTGGDNFVGSVSTRRSISLGAGDEDNKREPLSTELDETQRFQSRKLAPNPLPTRRELLGRSSDPDLNDPDNLNDEQLQRQQAIAKALGLRREILVEALVRRMLEELD